MNIITNIVNNIMPKTDVELAIYDLSGGLCKQLSMMLLGQQIDGIWHTSIVIFDKEITFGTDGISKIPKFQTILGEPLEVVKLGETRKTEKDLTKIIETWSQDKYAPEKYHLLNHNCNTFSNELSKWLVGKEIPSYITSLPDDILNSPLGETMLPFLERAGNIITETTAKINPESKKEKSKK